MQYISHVEVSIKEDDILMDADAKCKARQEKTRKEDAAIVRCIYICSLRLCICICSYSFVVLCICICIDQVSGKERSPHLI